MTKGTDERLVVQCYRNMWIILRNIRKFTEMIWYCLAVQYRAWLRHLPSCSRIWVNSRVDVFARPAISGCFKSSLGSSFEERESLVSTVKILRGEDCPFPQSGWVRWRLVNSSLVGGRKIRAEKNFKCPNLSACQPTYLICLIKWMHKLVWCSGSEVSMETPIKWINPCPVNW